MRTSQEGVALIKRFEGFQATPYYCPAGILTIGYGHIRDAAAHSAITETQAEALLRQDLHVAEDAVLRLVGIPLRQNQFDALVSFTFNLGAGALQRSTLRRVVNRGMHADVPRELMRWVFARGRKLNGLIARRRAEALLYSAELPNTSP
jgi:lysozyme